MKTKIAGALAAMTLLVGAARAEAQVFTPSFMSPERTQDVGVYVSDGPGDFSVEGIWRRNLGGYDLGFRAGVADASDVILLMGAEFRMPLDVDAEPIDVAFAAGVQGAIGGGGAAGFQGGVTVGYALVQPEFRFVPYINPRLALVNGFRRDSLELDVLADIGFDFVLRQNIAIRLGFGLGSPTSGWGIGFAWR